MSDIEQRIVERQARVEALRCIWATLTRRQLECLTLAGLGLNEEDVGAVLGISQESINREMDDLVENLSETLGISIIEKRREAEYATWGIEQVHSGMMPLWGGTEAGSDNYRDIDGWKLTWAVFYEETVSPDLREHLLRQQDYGCAICGGLPVGRRTEFDVDHDHQTGEIRGLLCAPCNQMLGFAQDNPEILLAGALYLEQDHTGNPYYRPQFRKSKCGQLWLSGKGDLCQICGQQESVLKNDGSGPRQLAIDHDHQTGLVRGLLCLRCNQMLGLARDNPSLLRIGADYLRNPPCSSNYIPNPKFDLGKLDTGLLDVV